MFALTLYMNIIITITFNYFYVIFYIVIYIVNIIQINNEFDILTALFLQI